MDENSKNTKDIGLDDEVSWGSKGKRYIKTSENQSKSSFEIIGTALSWIIVVITFPISIFICFFKVNEFDRAIIFRLGRVRKDARGPGLVWHLPCIDSYRLVDLRTRVELIPSQDAITKDSVTISVDAVLFYCIQNAMHSTIQISNVHTSTIFLAQATLRNMVGSMTLHDLLISRQLLSRKITIAVDHATEKWGVKIERVELLPESLQRLLASEAEALRDARAKIISAEGELNASKALQEASEVMALNEITLQLRHLQTLTSLAQEHHLTIVYPFPMEIMAPFTESGDGVSRKDTDDNGDVSLPGSSLRLFKSIISSVLGSTPELITTSPHAENEISPNPNDSMVLNGNSKTTQTDFPD
ncbi:band 7 protein AGAP004871-like isoform X2 [Drosophila innubila]|uniref:band 7 protein AGAP004871-like isoform X2 n=1 Tax=Drosophila innubila TaxID=198719 RepID=UPI00148CAF0C|nr:band 7 protein AGAP004871-like isoform X2 [Drosophila innubila]